MAENQTATEDSGQQSQHRHTTHQNQQQQQTQSSQQEQASPTSSPQDYNSAASSPDDSQSSIAIPKNNSINTALNHHHQHHNHQMPEHQQARSMIDRQQPNAKLKSNALRRNSMQTPMRSATTTAIRKPPLAKMNSLTNASSVGGLERQQQQHHHHHHHHSQHVHHGHHNNTSNNTSNHHHSGSSTSSIIQRTTSESLRLNSLPGEVTAITPANLSNATSASSLSLPLSIWHNNNNANSANNNNNNNSSTSSSTTALPRSTSTASSNASSLISNKSVSTIQSNKSKTAVPATNTARSSISSNASSVSVTATNRAHNSHGHHANAALSASRKPKTDSSFEITSVTMGKRLTKVKPEHRGEESADDLDESHTDDNSRVTDIDTETPSASDDTSFSKEEVYFANNALSSTAPVIPTSSQYGLVVVEPLGGPTLGEALQNMQVNLTDNIINVVTSLDGQKKGDEDLKDSQQRSERFKVVKIESTEPFKRGRWVCMDYLDHSSMGGTAGGNGGEGGEKTANSETAAGEGIAADNGANDDNQHAAKTTQSMIIGAGAAALLLDNHNDISGNSLPMVPGVEGHWTFIPEGQEPPAQQMTAVAAAATQSTEHSSGIATAPATIATGLQEIIKEGSSPSDGVDRHLSAESQDCNNSSQQAKSGDSGIEANAHETSAPEEAEAMDFATAAAQKLRKAQEELKQQEEAILASEKAGAVYVPAQTQPVSFINPNEAAATQQAATLPGEIKISTSEPKTHAQTQNEIHKSLNETQAVAGMQHAMSVAHHNAAAIDLSQKDVGTIANRAELELTQQTAQMVVPSPQQQLSPATPKIQQQISQTDGPAVTPTLTAASNTPQMPSQFQQQQQQQQQTQGQTMPYASPSAVYEAQQQQTHLTAANSITLQQQHSAPSVSVMDNQAIVAALQAHQAETAAVNQLNANMAANPLMTSTSSPNVTIQTSANITSSSMGPTSTVNAATNVSANSSNITVNPTTTINPLTNLPSTTIITPNVLPPTTIITPNVLPPTTIITPNTSAAATAMAASNLAVTIADEHKSSPQTLNSTTLPSTTNVIQASSASPSLQQQTSTIAISQQQPTQTTAATAASVAAASIAAAAVGGGATAAAATTTSATTNTAQQQQGNPAETTDTER